MQDSRYFLGNSVVWFSNDGGYTDDLSNAKVYTADEARDISESKGEFQIPWPKDYIDSKTKPTVDAKDIERREADRAVIKVIPMDLPKCNNCDDIITEVTCLTYGCLKWQELQKKGKLD
jgi:hypothetical protein